MAINFPSSPTNGQTYSEGERTWQYSTTAGAWKVVSLPALSISPPGGRLTNTSGVPAPKDTMAATTIYYTPHLHNYVPLYDGTRFIMTDTGGELSQLLSDSTKSPAAAAADSNYDMFVWNDAGTIRCTRGPAWTSATARGTGAATTELERVKGFWVNKVAITNGPAANRGTYVGTIRTNASSLVDFRLFASGTTVDLVAHVMVWNMYNRVRVVAESRLTTASWTYASTTFRGRNGATTGAIMLVSGMADDAIEAHRHCIALNSAAGASRAYIGIGLDSTSAIVTGAQGQTQSGTGLTTPASTFTELDPLLGHHYLMPLERAESANTVTWYTDGPQFIAGWMA